MNENTNFVEYSVEQKPEGKYLARKILLIGFYVVFAAVYFFMLTLGPVKIPMLIALLPLFLWIIIFFTWRYAAVEHEYTIVSGTMRLAEVYGNKTHKTIIEVKIKDMSVIAPWNEEAKAKLPAGISKTYNMLPSKSSPDAYYAVCGIEGGQKILILFDAIEKALKIMKFYNSAAIVVTKTRY